ncbi:MAG: CHASE domain-containing protein [Methylotenera sp.]|nr:CHASE domain-containing protein [Methylotenera sp.]
MKRFKYNDLNRPVALTLITLMIGLSVTYQLFQSAQIKVDREKQVYFDFRVREASNLISQRMQAYEQVLLGASGLFEASNNVDRHEFEQYVAALNLAENYPGIQGVGFSLIISSDKKAQHIASIRSEGFSEYTIRPEGQRDIYSSIIYLEPFLARNLRAFGYDMFSEPIRHEAMQKAIDSAQSTLTGKVRLVQETGKQEQAGFLMYVPIYRNGTNNDTLSERRENLLGWVYAPFRMNDLMHGLFGEYANDLSIQIFDGKNMSTETLMYGSDSANLSTAEFAKTLQLKIENHTWSVRIHALPSINSRVDVNRAKQVAVAGTVISVLLSLLIWFLATGRERAIKTAEYMNSELINKNKKLSDSEGKLQAVLSASEVAIAWTDESGAIEYINQKFISMFGYTLNDVPSIEQWYLNAYPDASYRMKILDEWNTKVTKSLSMREAIEPLEVQITCKNGSICHVMLMASWVGTKLLANFSDITARKQVESELKIAANVFESQEGMLVTDANNIILRVNSAFTRITGYRSEEAVGNTPNLLKSGNQDTGFYNSMWESIGREGYWEGEIWNKSKNGEVYLEHLTITSIKDNAGAVTNYVATLTDITERNRLNAELTGERQRLTSIIEGANVGTWEWNVQTGKTKFNALWAKFIGYDLSELEPSTIQTWIDNVHPDDMKLATEVLDKYFSGELTYYECEMRMRHKDGHWIWILDRGKVTSWTSDGKPLMMFGTHTDITERKRLELELTRQAHLDYLTGLSNRRHFMEQGLVELSRAIRYDTPLSLMMLDIDFFKNVNDTYGHQLGDTVLQALSKVCQDTMRQVDVVGRLGGEEFAVILPETTSEEALDVAERLRESIAKTEVTIPVGLPIHFTISIGVTTLSNKNVNIDTLLNQADKALYEAKETGRNKVCIG